MLRTIIQLTAILLSNAIFTQGTFELTFTGSKDQLPGTMFETDQGEIILSIMNEPNAFLVRIDQTGTIVDSVKFQNAYGNCWLSTLKKSSSNKFYAFGGKKDTSSYFWIARMNTDLTIEKDTCLLIGGDIEFKFMYVIVNSKGNYVVVMPYYLTSMRSHLIVFEITQDLELVRMADLGNPGPTYIFVSDLIQNTENEYEILVDKIASKDNASRWLLDSNFTIQESVQLPWQLELYSSILQVGSRTRVYSGRRYFFQYNSKQLVLIKYTSDGIPLDSLEIGNPSYNEWTGVHNSLASSAVDSFYFAGTHKVTTTNPYFSISDNYLILLKLDTNLNIKWQQLYGGDACYLLFNVIATNDGGCVMASTRYDELTQNLERDVHLLKVNSNGVVLWTHEFALPIQDINIYPNPGRDFIHVQSNLQKFKFTLYDNQGKTLIEEEVNSNNAIVDACKIKSGYYVYCIFNSENRLIKSGKWIKIE